MDDLAGRVRQLREMRGWAQVELATAAKVSRPLISLIESGKRDNPTVDVVRRLAKALGVPLVMLIGDDKEAATVA